MLEISILEIQINFLDDEPTILIIFYIKTLKHSFSLLVLKGLRVVQKFSLGIGRTLWSWSGSRTGTAQA